MERTFQFELLTPQGVVLRDTIQEVIAPGREGYFGVRAGHEHFATILKPGVLTVKWPEKSRHYEITGGIIQVTPGKAVVCAESATLREIKHE